MTDINFNITGIENLIEDFNKARCYCDNKACVNNAAWSGRNQGCYAPACLLPSAHIDEWGNCGDVSDGRDEPREAGRKIRECVALIKLIGQDAKLISTDLYRIDAELIDKLKEVFAQGV